MNRADKVKLKEIVTFYKLCQTEGEIMKINQETIHQDSAIKKFIDVFDVALNGAKGIFGKSQTDMFCKFYLEKRSLGHISYLYEGMNESEISRKVTECAYFILRLVEPRYKAYMKKHQNQWLGEKD